MPAVIFENFRLGTNSDKASLHGVIVMTGAQARFFGRFKAELMEGGAFENLEQARSEIFSYIEGYYNLKRLDSSVGYKTPLEYEAELKRKEQREESFLSIFS